MKFFMLVITILCCCIGLSIADVYVRGYYKENGTYVAPHWRSEPDNTVKNNWSFPGNTNPHTGYTTPTGNSNDLYKRLGIDPVLKNNRVKSILDAWE